MLEKYNASPQNIRDILSDKNLGLAIQVIGKDHRITPAQALEVEDVVVHTLLGIEPPQTLAERIQKSAGVSAEAAQEIASDLDENIFAPVKDLPAETQSAAKAPTIPIPPVPSAMTPPKESPVPPLIIGIERMRDSLSKEVASIPTEHLFEEKLRNIATPAPMKESNEVSSIPLIPPTPQEKREDPYKESTI